MTFTLAARTTIRDGLNNSNADEAVAAHIAPFGIWRMALLDSVVFFGDHARFLHLLDSFPDFRRTHPLAPINWLRTIQRLDSANSVTSCAVFFFKPR